jgi:microcystin-dependent protein
MTSIIDILLGDYQDDSVADLNDNFDALNAGKTEKSGDTMTGLLQFSGTNHGGLKVLSLTTAQRDLITPGSGMVIYNTTLAVIQMYQNGGWVSFSMHETGDLVWSTRTSKTGFLILDGSLGNVSRTTYSDLFTLWSTKYGVGDGSTTFGLPNVMGRVLVAAGTGTKVATFVSRSSDTITASGLSNVANNEFQTGQAVVYHTSATVITGLTNNVTYYVIRISNTTFKLAATLADAQNGVAISLSSSGTGTQTFTETFTARTVDDLGGEENHAQSLTELLAHTHTFSEAPAMSAGSGVARVKGQTDTTNGPITINNAGGNAAMNNMQPFLVENLFVKY